MPFNEITAALASVKVASDIAKGILSLNKDVAVNEKAIELLSSIISLQKDLLSLQSEYGELLKSKSDLEEQLKQFDAWSKTDSQYKLDEVSTGIFVRSPKNLDKSKEPMHWLCTHCWEDKKKSVLQLNNIREYYTDYICPRCKNTFDVRNGTSMPHQRSIKTPRPWQPGDG